jgi:hypothetical protein
MFESSKYFLLFAIFDDDLPTAKAAIKPHKMIMSDARVGKTVLNDNSSLFEDTYFPRIILQILSESTKKLRTACNLVYLWFIYRHRQ